MNRRGNVPSARCHRAALALGAVFALSAAGARGATFGVKLDGYVQGGFVRNDASTGAQRKVGLSNYPIAQASDEGAIFNTVQVFLHRDMGGNIAPRVGPTAAPPAEGFSYGFMIEGMYGRNGQAARSFGFDSSLGVNHPGDRDPARAAADFQNFVAFPNVYVQFGVPFARGIALTVGRFGAGVSYEIPVQTRTSPNYFYSRSYAFVGSPNQVTGALLSAMLARNATGLWLGEIGVVNGWQNWHDDNGEKSVLAALRWRASDFETGANLTLLTGDEQNEPASTPQMPNNRVVSPHGQRRTHLALDGFHQVGPVRLAAEVLYGRQEGDGRPETLLLGPGGGPRFRGAEYSGANVHASYQVTESVSVGLRVERFDDPDGFALFPTTAVHSAFNAVTVGAHLDVARWLRLRPELRYDWQSDYATARAFGAGRKTHQAMVAIDGLLFF